MEEILKRQLLMRGREFATFSAIEKAFAGRKKSFRGPYAVQACHLEKGRGKMPYSENDK